MILKDIDQVLSKWIIQKDISDTGSGVTLIDRKIIEEKREKYLFR